MFGQLRRFWKIPIWHGSASAQKQMSRRLLLMDHSYVLTCDVTTKPTNAGPISWAKMKNTPINPVITLAYSADNSFPFTLKQSNKLQTRTLGRGSREYSSLNGESTYFIATTVPILNIWNAYMQPIITISCFENAASDNSIITLVSPAQRNTLVVFLKKIMENSSQVQPS